MLIYCVFFILSKLLEVNAQPSGIEIQEALEVFVTPILKANEDEQHTAPVSLKLIHLSILSFTYLSL